MTPTWAGGAWAELLHGLNLPVPSPQSLWIERTTLTLTHSLPGISRWFEVERRELVRNDSNGAGFTVLPQSLLGGPFSEEEEKEHFGHVPAWGSHRQSCAGGFAHLPSLL